MEIPDFSISIVHDSIIVVIDNNKNLELSNYVINHVLTLFKGTSLGYQNQAKFNYEIETSLYKLVHEGRLFKKMDGWHFASSMSTEKEDTIPVTSAAQTAYFVCGTALNNLGVQRVDLLDVLELEILHASIIKYTTKHYSHINECDLITQAHNLIFNKRTEHAIAYANSTFNKI